MGGRGQGGQQPAGELARHHAVEGGEPEGGGEDDATQKDQDHVGDRVRGNGRSHQVN